MLPMRVSRYAAVPSVFLLALLALAVDRLLEIGSNVARLGGLALLAMLLTVLLLGFDLPTPGVIQGRCGRRGRPTGVCAGCGRDADQDRPRRVGPVRRLRRRPPTIQLPSRLRVEEAVRSCSDERSGGCSLRPEARRTVNGCGRRA